MHRRLRFAAAIILVLSILFLARNQVLGAGSEASPSISVQEEQRDSALPAPGTVKPPPFDVVIPVTGDYSLGGFCTLSVELTDAEITLNANLLTPLPGELPKNVHKVRQGCLLTYNRASQILDELPTAAGSTMICFAGTPNQQMTVYFYDIYSTDPTWTALETTFEANIACAPANASGVYIATFST